MRLRRLALIAALSGLAVSVGASAQVPEETIGIGLAEAPESRRDDPRALVYIVDHVDPGTTITRRFFVTNRTSEQRRLELYVGSADIGAASFDIEAGRGTGELSSWSSVDPPEVVLAPGERSTATVSITVPRDATAGERYGAVLAELPAEPSPGVLVAQGARVGIRIYLSVGGAAEPKSDFEIETLTARRLRDGTPEVIARVRNTGGRALDMAGELRLTDGPGGVSAGPFDATLGTVLGIGRSAPVVVPLEKDIPPGPWLARLTLRSGNVERVAEATIQFPREAGKSAPPVEAREVTGTLPGIIATGVSSFLVIVLAGWLFWFLLKRRRRGRDEDGSDRD